MQSISVRSARGGAIAAAAAVRQASLSTAAHCSLAAVRSTGDGGFLERCSGLSRRWRKRLSACARGVARCTALLLPLQVEPPSLDPSLAQRSCEGSNDRNTHGDVAKRNAAKPVEISAQADFARLNRANPRTTDQTVTAVVPPLPLLSAPKSSAPRVPRLRSSASLCRSPYRA